MSQNIIYKKDYDNCQINIKNKQTVEVLGENKIWQDTAGSDCLKRLGPISKEEIDYYTNL
ncbi:MAG TPA: hypothetical protein PKH95_00165 [Candidatus Magasanikbacteria bacterium]|nr:hypothetical protein [Candidatus Magasanikbacteria bacterium]